MARGAGDYLKTRRALIRSVEKQAAMAERLDALKTAIFEGAPGAPLRVCGRRRRAGRRAWRPRRLPALCGAPRRCWRSRALSSRSAFRSTAWAGPRS